MMPATDAGTSEPRMSTIEQSGPDRSHDALSRIRRMAITIAMLPALPIAAYLATEYVGELSEATGYFAHIGADGEPQTDIDGLRLLEFCTSAAFVLGLLFIWRRFVLWTAGRKVWTSIVALVPFVQVIVGRPWWDAGCVTEDVLRLGQEHIGIGLWIWLVIWIWWGCERLRLSRSQSNSGPWSKRMDRLTRTVVGCIAVIPVCFSIACIAYAVAEDLLNLSDNMDLVLAYGVSACTCLIAWWLFWRRHVVWSKRVVARTLLLWLVCMPVPIAIMPFMATDLGIVGVTFWNLPLIGWGVWIALTMRIWPLQTSSFHDIPDGPKCLKCGYSLRGLSNTKCPECGDEQTLDALWAGQSV